MDDMSSVHPCKLTIMAGGGNAHNPKSEVVETLGATAVENKAKRKVKKKEVKEDCSF